MAQQPKLGSLATERLVEPGVLLVVTIRRDGTARLSPVEPVVMEGDLWLSMMWQSTKARDLLRDQRVLVHSVVSGPSGEEGEFKVRGRAEDVHDVGVQRRYADQVAATLDWEPEPGRFHLFRIDIDEVVYIRYDNATGDQHVGRWPPAQEYIRRGTTATSVGDPEPVTDWVLPDDSGSFVP
jgi:hypothetical protein